MENNEEEKSYIPNQVVSKESLKTYFENGDVPDEQDFWEWQDSYWHKNENIPTQKIDGLNEVIANAGKNIYNTNGTLNSPRTVNTAGNPLNITGLPDKSSDATFNRMRVQNESGQEAWGNGANVLISGMTASTDAQKEAWRLANRKTGENYSLGQPRVDAILPIFLDNLATVQNITLIGLNLFLNNSSSSTANLLIQRVADLAGNPVTDDPITITNFQVSQANPNTLTFSLITSSMNKGKYKVTVIHNGLENLIKPEFYIFDQLNNFDLSNIVFTKIVDSANRVSFNESAVIFASGNTGNPAQIVTNNIASVEEIGNGLMLSINGSQNYSYGAGGSTNSTINIQLRSGVSNNVFSTLRWNRAQIAIDGLVVAGSASTGTTSFTLFWNIKGNQVTTYLIRNDGVFFSKTINNVLLSQEPLTVFYNHNGTQSNASDTSSIKISTIYKV